MQTVSTGRTRAAHMISAVLSLGMMLPAVAAAQDIGMCQNRAYVSNSYQNTLSVIDTAASEVIATVPMRVPYNPVISPDLRRVYVPNTEAGTIAIVDVATNAVVANMEVAGGRPTGMAFTPSGAEMLVTLLGATIDDRASLGVINVATGEMGEPIPIGRQAERVTVSPDGRRAYAVNRDASLTVVDIAERRVIANVALRDNGFNAIVSPDSQRVYVAMRAAGLVAVIDAASNEVEQYIPVGAGAIGLAFGAGGRGLYVTSNGTSMIHEISMQEHVIVRSGRLSAPPGLLRVSGDGRRAYVAHSTSTYVSVVDLASLTETARIETGGPTSLAIC